MFFSLFNCAFAPACFSLNFHYFPYEEHAVVVFGEAGVPFAVIFGITKYNLLMFSLAG